jgi:signal transduction histidine kinase
VSANNAQRYQTPVDGIELVASLAHEINNPIGALLDLLFLMEPEAEFTPKGREYLKLAHQELHRLSQIAHGAMDEARATLILQNTDISELLRAVVQFYESRFAAHGVSIHTSYSSSEKLRVHRGSVRQMFSNVLLNAADAMPQGGKIYVRIREAHEWRGMKRRGLRVTFADNGRGILAENLPKVTDAFFTTKGSAGTGLGLSLVKDTVKEHDGVLRVRSSTRPGRSGTVFTIFLPTA